MDAMVSKLAADGEIAAGCLQPAVVAVDGVGTHHLSAEHIEKGRKRLADLSKK